MPKHRHTLERLQALIVSLGLACLFGSRFSQVIGHLSFSLLILWLCVFPEIHTRARYFKALMLIEDPLHILKAIHVNDPEAERMAEEPRSVLGCLSEHDRSSQP
jgi:hypothetical protein